MTGSESPRREPFTAVSIAGRARAALNEADHAQTAELLSPSRRRQWRVMHVGPGGVDDLGGFDDRGSAAADLGL